MMLTHRRRCEICGLVPAEHGPTRLGRVYSAPFGWHEHTTVAGRVWPHTPPPPGYRPCTINLATPEPEHRESFTPWKRDEIPPTVPVSLESPSDDKNETEPEVKSLPPRPRTWWGGWRRRRGAR